MIVSSTKLNVRNILLYDTSDAALMKDVVGHLVFELRKKGLDGVICQNVAHYRADQQDIRQYIEHATTIICLVSHRFISSDFGFSKHLQRIAAANRLRRTCVLPIVVDDCRWEESPFRIVRPLVANKEPINAIPLINKQRYIQRIVGEAVDRIQQTLDYERQMLLSWEQAEKENTIESYARFLKKYEYSRYTPLAEQRHDRLVENKLWRTALSKNDVQHLFLYLKDAPMQIHAQKAIGKIVRLKQQPKVTDTKQAMDQVTPVEDAHFLQYRIHVDCTPQEHFRYEQVANSCRQLGLSLQGVKGYLGARKKNIYTQMILYVLLPLLLVLANGLMQPAFLETLLNYKWLIGLALSLVLLQVGHWQGQLTQLVKECQQNERKLQYAWAWIELAYLLHDTAAKDSGNTFLQRTMERLLEVKTQRQLKYLWEYFDKENQKAKGKDFLQGLFDEKLAN
ncbi:MAG: hypothetical protein AAF990_26520 [Bacteroidota bacterium]